jgi:predicted lipid carrier protein YhbT
MTQRVIHRRVEDYDAVLLRHDQVVGGAADYVLNIRRQLDQLEAAVLRVADLVAVEKAAASVRRERGHAVRI